MLLNKDCVRIFSILSLLASASNGHDLYLLPGSFRVSPGTTLEVGFHNGDSFPESEAAAHLERLKDAQLRSSKGAVSIHGLKVAGKRVVGNVQIPTVTGNILLSVRTVPNFISMKPDKFLEYLKEEGLTNIIEWRAQHGESNKPSRERYTKFAKSLLQTESADETFKQSLGFPIEIIPETNPYDLRAGAELLVRVMLNGKPAVHLQMETAWAANGKSKTTVIGRTDAEGRIRVPLAAAGKWRLHTLDMQRCAEPAVADWESLWASLTFEIR